MIKDNRTIGFSACAVVFLALLYGCTNEAGLSREEAARLIAATDTFSRPQQALHLSNDAFKEGQALVLWDRAGNVTPEAQREAISAKGNLTLPKSFTLRVEVTGITDKPIANGVIKRVEYTWSYKDLTPFGSVFAKNGGVGSAHLRQYDDGWRVIEAPKITFSSERFPASDDAKALVKSLAAKIAARLMAEAEKRAQLLANCKKDTQELLKASQVRFMPRSHGGALQLKVFRLTDAHLVAEADNLNGGSVPIWFGDINRYRYKGFYNYTDEYLLEVYDNNTRWFYFKNKSVADEFVKKFELAFASWVARCSTVAGR